MSQSYTVEFATVLAGAVPFEEGNINQTFRGQVLRSDGAVTQAVLKDVPAKEIANELIAFVLARRLSLPVPDTLLAVADDALITLSRAPTTTDRRRLLIASVDVRVPNIQFRCLADPSAELRLLGALAAWPPLGRLYGFDTWIANIDRHAGNLLFGAGADVWLIDHGWAFTGPAWEATALSAASDYRHRLREWLTPRLSEAAREMRARQVGNLESELRSIDIEAAIKGSCAELLLAADDVEALDMFLRARIGHVVRLARNALEVPALL